MKKRLPRLCKLLIICMCLSMAAAIPREVYGQAENQAESVGSYEKIFPTEKNDPQDSTDDGNNEDTVTGYTYGGDTVQEAVYQTEALTAFASPVTVSGAALTIWTERTPIAGDRIFYLEVIGTGFADSLTPLEAEVFVWENSGYSKVASQTDRRYLGMTDRGEERYIFQMAMDGAETLVSSQLYYIDIKDAEGNYLFPDRSVHLFMVWDSGTVHLDSPTVSVISAAADWVDISFDAYGFPPGQSKNDLDVELWQYDGMDWDGPSGQGTKWGEMNREIMTVDEMEEGGYRITGRIFLIKNETTFLKGGEKLYLKTTGSVSDGTKKNAFPFSAVRVLSGAGPAAESLEIKNGVGGTEGQGYGHGYDPAEPDTPVYVIGNSAGTIEFEMIGAGMTEPEKVSAWLTDGENIIGGLKPGTVKIEPLAHGICRVSGVAEITGPVPVAGASLVIAYNDTPVSSAVMKRSGLAGVENLWYGEDSYHFGQIYQLPLAGEIHLWLEGALNIQQGAITAHLIGRNGARISLAVSAQSVDNGVFLTLTPEAAVKGEYMLELRHAGHPFQGIYYDFSEGELKQTGDLAEGVNALCFEFSDEPVLKSIRHDQGDLLISGVGFHDDALYEGKFIKRIGAALNSEPFSVPASFVSKTELRIEEEAVKNLPRGWYTVYLTADDGQIKGFADTALFSAAASGPSLILPKATIQNDAKYTTEAEVTITFSAGSYTKVKFAETQAGLDTAAWQDILPAVSYRLSEGFGTKTIFFSFRTDTGEVYSFSKSILYRGTALENMLAYGVTDGNLSEGTVYLHKDMRYTLFIQSNQLNLTGKVEFYDENNILIRTEELKRTASSNGIHTYSKSVPMDAQVSGAKAINFYLEDKEGFVSAEERIPVSIRTLAYISQMNTVFKTKNYHQLYVENDSEVQYSFTGTPGFLARARLTYVDAAEDTRTAEYSLSSTGINSYGYKAALPGGARKIVGIEYAVTDPNDGENQATKTEEKNLEVTGTIQFAGLENEAGDYNEKTITLFNDVDWYRRSEVIRDNKTGFAFEGLRPSTHYRYRVGDHAQVYAEGSITLEPGEKKVENLSGAQVPAKVRFQVTGADGPAQIAYRVEGSYYTRYVESGKELAGFFVGQELTYQLLLPDNEGKVYIIPGEKTVTLTEKAQTLDIPLEKLAKIKVSGTITDEKISGRNIAGCVISVYQNFFNGYRSVYHNDTTVTDQEGKYEMELYRDFPVIMNIAKDGYVHKYIDFSPETDLVKNESLTYNRQKIITVNPFTRPLLEQGEEADPAGLLGMDRYKIQGVTVKKTDGTTVSAYYSGYRSAVQIYDDQVKPQEKVRLYFHFSPGMLPEQEFYEITLDEYLNGTVDPVAVPGGQVTAHVMTGGDNPPAAYMLLYDEDGAQAAVISGTGSLSSELQPLKEGAYTGILLKGYALQKVRNLKLLEAFSLLDLQENTHYVRKTFNIEKGRRTHLGDIEIPELVFDENLGFTETSIKTKYTPNDATGELLVLANFRPETGLAAEETTLERISIRTSAALKSNGAFYDGEWYTYNDFTPRDKNNLDGLLYFTLIPPQMEQTTLTVVLTYRINGETHQESFGAENIDAPKVTVIPPAEVFLGEKAKNVLVRGIGLPDSTIEIYDNDILIGVTKVPAKKTNYQTAVALSFPDDAAGHLLYAKMITPDRETHMSAVETCEVIDPQKAAYTSDFVFNNGSGRSFINQSPNESNSVLTLSYNPSVPTHVSFRINNLLKDQISYAGLVSRSNGVDTMFEAAHKQDVEAGNVKYSEWELTERLGYLGDLSVYYALAFDEPLAPISGTKAIDFAQAVQQPEVDPAFLPDVLLDRLDQRTITEEEDRLTVIVPVADSGSVKVTGSFSKGHVIREEDLKAQGYRKFETVQGYYWAKESMTENGNSLEYHKSLYFSPALTAILEDGGGTRIMGLRSNTLRPLSTTDDVLSKADYAGYVYNVGEIVNDTSPNPANLGKVGTGMQVLGGAVLAGQVLMGPASKDHQTLYTEAAKVEDALIRSRLGDEIREYDRARRSAHSVNTLFGGVSYGAGFAGPVGKGLSYLVSTGGMVFGQKTGTELDIWWDAVMRDIQNEITLQERRKKQKEKPKPGKRDEQKRPNWKIDPSGYVFEAIDANRVEGVTASVLLKNELDNAFYFWQEAEEWEEINPDTTDQEGKYGWDVPAGDWKVRFEGAGYETAETKEMTVPPVHDQVNIGLLSTKTPEVAGAALDSTGLEVEFDIFMQGETIYDGARQTENITVTDSAGTVVPCKRVDFIIAADNDGYQRGGLYQTSVIEAAKFVKRIRFVPDAELYPGGFRELQDDGETPETYQVTLNTNIQSYAGVHLEADYQGPALTVGQREKAALPQADPPSGGYGAARQVAITTETAGATIYYTTDGTTPTALSSVYKEPLTVSKTTVIKVLASKVGMDDSEVVTLHYTIGPEIGHVAAAPTANIPSGTYDTKQSVTLSTTTDGATIYYTTDGTVPATDKGIYTSPILIGETTTIKAMAVKAGYVNSGIATFHYIMKKGGSSGNSGGGGNRKEKIVSEEIVPEEVVPEEIAPEDLNSRFSDISHYAWAEEAIVSLTEQGIIKGVSDTSFAPGARIKRADSILLMVRLFGMAADVRENFSDVAPEKYYYHEIGIAKELGFINGMGNNQFNPEEFITRQDMFVIADRILKAQGLLNEEEDRKVLEKFTDHELISSYAKQPVANLVSQEYVLGSGNRLHPLDHVTRAETAVFIYRISQRMAAK